MAWHTGELEATFFRTFSRAANLRALLFDSADSPGIQAVKNAFQRSFSTELSGSLGTDLVPLGAVGSTHSLGVWDSSKPVFPLTPEDFHSLSNLVHESFPGVNIRNEVQITRKIQCHGVDFTSRSASQKNSQVLFTLEGGDQHFGQIEQILVHRVVLPHNSEIATMTYARIFLYKPIPPQDRPLDPFGKFPLLRTRLMENAFEEKAVIVKTSNILSHVAVCKMPGGANRIAIMSLDRVSYVVFNRNFTSS